MRLAVLAFAFAALAGPALADPLIAPTGRLRAAFLQGNPAQGTVDPASGESRGVVVDLAGELGRQIGTPVQMVPVAGVAAVIDAVKDGRADIGFVAYDPSRAGTVEFSQTYMLVKQTFLVLQDSPIQSVRDIDRPEFKIGAGRGDSIALYLQRNLDKAKLVEGVTAGPETAKQMLQSRAVDAFGGNRQRLAGVAREEPAYRVLPDDLFGVPQAIIVPKGKPTALMTVNRLIDETRTSGFLKSAIERAQVIGVDVAPATDR